MARSDVLSIIGTDTFDARSVKGCEIAGVETSMAGMSSSWVIFLRYDPSDRLTAADAAFTNNVTSIFSLDEHSVFQ